jgi:hypothetical protein
MKDPGQSSIDRNGRSKPRLDIKQNREDMKKQDGAQNVTINRTVKTERPREWRDELAKRVARQIGQERKAHTG